jgi:hypothetical protein
VALCAQAASSAATAVPDDQRIFTSYDAEVLVVDNTAGGVGFTLSKIRPTNQPFQAMKAVVTVECATGDTCDFRFWTTGRAPTASEGHLYGKGGQFVVLEAIDIWRFRAIRTDTVSAKLMVTYYKQGT